MNPDFQFSEDDILSDFILFSSSDELMEWGEVPGKAIHDSDQNANPVEVQHDQITTPNKINQIPEPMLMGSVVRVPKNDIRRYFGKMLMNTLNSGEFILIQDFFKTFLTARCQFRRITHNLPVKSCMPKVIGGNGPLQFSHYFLGLLTMFPDLLLVSHGSRIVTISNSKLTKIVLDIECQSTETVSIPNGLWIPPEHMLNDIYSVQNMDEIVWRRSNNIQGTYQKDSAAQLWDVGAPLDLKLLEKKLLEEQQRLQPLSNKRKLAEKSCSNNSMSEASSVSSISTASSLRTDNTSAVSNPSSAGSQLSADTTYIPFKYTSLLQESAVLLPVPMSHHSLGQVELVMDENQHIVYIQMCTTLV